METTILEILGFRVSITATIIGPTIIVIVSHRLAGC